MAKCKVCGARYNKADVAEEILQVCHIWSDSDFGGLCFDCALNKFVEDTGHDPYADPEDEGENPGCVACGNPAYPDCMDSCPMYDD